MTRGRAWRAGLVVLLILLLSGCSLLGGHLRSNGASGGVAAGGGVGISPILVEKSQKRNSYGCGQSHVAPAQYQHVIWIWLENRSYGDVIGTKRSKAYQGAPYLNQLAEACGIATNYHNITHPSQPNYFAALSGTTGGVSTNCEPATCSLKHLSTLFTQVAQSGRQWRSYEESMSATCAGGNEGEYVDRHNPEVYFTSDKEQCEKWDVPLAGTGGLAAALKEDTLPAFSFIAPNVCEDMHSCPARTGDNWLKHWVPLIQKSPEYRAGSTVVFITFDEGSKWKSYQCSENTVDPGCHVPMIVVSPYTPAGTRVNTLFNHYSLLHTTEELLGMQYFLGHAGDVDTRSMTPGFHL